ncbi:hypothetical protein CAI21_18855 [Alkalilimnicola ehrlichii]|uniref:Uncharacterized protein n=1 Tax=Alkalilimnicola ehrlichii TaxID=351052 RepID=A0A3E0WKG7_9GAMM|nr:hypothetical protein [Alkalilimnicola ehrlichii]RFA25585.1 hypothetical protein CAI21_18855 [Alkalilimnicola ehrlichii]RFA32713.1 hypothetical protein CAL65_19120 [Alkalilimnicola ehrlichii]
MRVVISEAAWRLARTLHSNPQAVAGGPAVLDQSMLLAVFGGDEELLSAAFDELLIVPLQLGEEGEGWSEVRVLAAMRFEPREDDVWVHYQFDRHFLKLLALAGG